MTFAGGGYLGDAYKYSDGLEELADPMYRNAIKLANNRLKVNPSDGPTMGLLAHYHASVGNRDEALEYIARASALEPGDLYVQYNSATAFCAIGDVDKAATALTRAVEMGYSKKLIVVDANLCSLVERPEFQPE